MSVRPDNRLDDAPMVPVTCRACGAEVLARKSSWQQTSVQWSADAARRCPQRRDSEALAGHGRQTVFLSCSELSESIVDAVRTGRLCIVDETVDAAP
ncbi:ferredoxin [Mycolicibacterium litorale]|uniref:ferredoxin n=1 Tax=Mycolicibacterium litorale TaxID=758802 RepID=UPI003CF7233F